MPVLCREAPQAIRAMRTESKQKPIFLPPHTAPCRRKRKSFCCFRKTGASSAGSRMNGLRRTNILPCKAATCAAIRHRRLPSFRGACKSDFRAMRHISDFRKKTGKRFRFSGKTAFSALSAPKTIRFSFKSIRPPPFLTRLLCALPEIIFTCCGQSITPMRKPIGTASGCIKRSTIGTFLCAGRERRLLQRSFSPAETVGLKFSDWSFQTACSARPSAAACSHPPFPRAGILARTI